MSIPGLLGGPPGVRSARVDAPRRALVRGTPHHLAYITAAEAALLRARGGGLTRDGRPLRGPAGVPAFDDGGDGDGGGDGGDGADGGAGSDGQGDSGAADGHGDAGAADGHGNSPSGTSDGSGGSGDAGFGNAIRDLLPAGPDPRAPQLAAWRSALTAPIDQTPRNFVAGGGNAGSTAAMPVRRYDYGAFPTAALAIGALRPSPASPGPATPPAGPACCWAIPARRKAARSIGSAATRCGPRRAPPPRARPPSRKPSGKAGARGAG